MLRSAILLSAGLGTRMRPLTDHTPKALLPLAGVPLIDHTLARFEAAGVSRVVVNAHHFADQIAAHLARRPRARMEVVLVREEVLLESAGGIVHALGWLGDAPFFCANADTVWLDGDRPALAELARAYDPQRMDALMLLEPRDHATLYEGPGDVGLASSGEVVLGGDRQYVYRGLQVLHPRLFAGLAPTPRSLREIWRAAQRPDGSIARHHGLVHTCGTWLHVGTPRELEAAERFMHAHQRAP